MADYQETTRDGIMIRPVWFVVEPPEMLLSFFYDDTDKARKISEALYAQLELRGYKKVQEAPDMLELSEGVSFAVTHPGRTRAQALVDFKRSFSNVQEDNMQFIPAGNVEAQVAFVGHGLSMNILPNSAQHTEEASRLTQALRRELTTLRYNVRPASVGLGLVAESAGLTKNRNGQFSDFYTALTAAKRNIGIDGATIA